MVLKGEGSLRPQAEPGLVGFGTLIDCNSSS